MSFSHSPILTLTHRQATNQQKWSNSVYFNIKIHTIHVYQMANLCCVIYNQNLFIFCQKSIFEIYFLFWWVLLYCLDQLACIWCFPLDMISRIILGRVLNLKYPFIQPYTTYTVQEIISLQPIKVDFGCFSGDFLSFLF